jgi:CRISPR/Cas system-associated endoribonuclease Cas2
VKAGLLSIIDEDHDAVIIYQMRDQKWVDKNTLGKDKNPATNLL